MTEHSDPQGSPCPDTQRKEQQPTALVRIEAPTKAERLISRHATIAVLDTARYDQMWRVATAMAASSLVPESLCKNSAGPLPELTIIANCFKIVNLAERWQFDPFALMDCVSVVHGKLCFEGKVIHAAIEQCLGVRLSYQFTEGKGADMGVIVSATLSGETERREIRGRVKDWHRGPKSPWADEGAWERQLRYRGAREWCRAHSPGVLLGIYAPDEMDESNGRHEPQKLELSDAPPPRRAIIQEMKAGDIVDVAVSETVPAREQTGQEPAKPATEIPSGNENVSRETIDAPPPRRTGPIPVKGKAPKKETDKPAEPALDPEEAGWLTLFEKDLRECRNVMAVNEIVDRREKAIGLLSPAGKQRSTAIINSVLNDIMGKK